MLSGSFPTPSLKKKAPTRKYPKKRVTTALICAKKGEMTAKKPEIFAKFSHHLLSGGGECDAVLACHGRLGRDLRR